MNFVNKKILIISTEKWGINFLSKHHYAVELAKNNYVFFLNPYFPDEKKVIHRDPLHKALTVLNYVPLIRGTNKFINNSPWLFNIISKIDVWRLKRIAQSDFDIVWSFDPYRFQNLKLFRADLAIFHPVDYFDTLLDQFNAKTADIIFSVAKPILERYKNLKTPKFFINHGVSYHFLTKANISYKKNTTKIQCGYVGNLISKGIHYRNLVQIISENPEVEFHLIGPIEESNLGKSKDTGNWIEIISNYNNVIFYGQLNPGEVAAKINSFDLFLICYNSEKVEEFASNSHKILEFLSTGKVVVSSYISTYEDTAKDLFQMAKGSDELPELFKETLLNLTFLNNTTNQKTRKDLAFANSYTNHLQEIEKLIQQHIPN